MKANGMTNIKTHQYNIKNQIRFYKRTRRKSKAIQNFKNCKLDFFIIDNSRNVKECIYI